MFSSTILGGLLPTAALTFLGVCLAVSAIGFAKYVYFISIGYGFSVAAMAIVSCVLGGETASLPTWLEAGLLAAYGLRLGTFLVIREAKPSYRASQAADGDRPQRVGLGLKLAIWPTVAILYVIMFMPLIARFASEAAGKADPLPLLSAIGVVLTALGLVIEAVADAQKSAAKAVAPKRFCDSGLFRITRCPNYFGEILVWTGLLAAGAALLESWLAWALAAIGYACIVLIMIGSARRLEMKQDERYGADPGYQAYAKRVPVLAPFVPVYSLRNAKLYLG
jgi:steroid 5-alpha reductase family enzyme